MTNQNDFLDPEGDITLTDKQLMESPEMVKVASDVIEKHKLEFGPAEIGYFLVYPNLSKTKAAKCIKANREVKYFSGNDYLIEVSGDLWDMLDSETREMLIYHQLLHIDPVFKAKNQEWKMNIRKPDFSDYYEINDKFGNEWYKTIQATVSSLHDMDPRQEGKVSV
ncbi:MAG: putative metallopeptidase [Balneolaceae bacterium]